MYEKMYTVLFNAITDGLELIERQNYGLAAELLRKAQQRAEEIFISGAEENAAE